MSNYISSLISLSSNVKAAKSGNILRHLSVVGHTAKVINKLAKGQGGENAAKLCQGIIDTFNKATDGSTIGKIINKGVKISKNTDPISATCALIRTTKSDTPARTFIEEASAFAGTCLVENSMVKFAKDIANIKGIKTLNDKMVNFCKSKGGALSVVPSIVYGLLFVTGSALGEKAFHKLGTWVSDKLGLAKSKLQSDDLKTHVGNSKYYFG